ncbi:serine O-acetyltransferase [Acinetobacter radioresistens]|uniref:serine O-acetyltransferase n=1 Tax=Acinetobacter radioresistens TaxID=40216 RepID=UPI0022474D84|nr:serine O-acetyltransferase [Acinetobacter radioresistens]MCX0339644.1 serine O-acetyltransferase [Acinetobacter radioresistens]
MISLVKQDYKRLNKSNRFTYLGFLKSFIFSTGFQLVCLYRLSFFLRKKNIKLFSVILDKFIFFLYNCEIRSTAKIGPGLLIRHPIGIIIGGKAEIGENFSIGQNTTIGGNNNKTNNSRSQPIIGDNVTIGANSMIIGPLIIGNNSFIGSMSLVNKDIPSNETWAGIPARKIK